MKEVNNVVKIIKAAFEVKNESVEENKHFTRFLPFDSIRNMRDIINDKEMHVSKYQLFFEKFIAFINKELLNKELLAQLYQGEENGDFLIENEITFTLEGLEEKFQKKQEHALYLKILTLLTNSSFTHLAVSQVLQVATALELFLSNKSDFFQAADFPTKIEAVYYSLTHADAFDVAKMLLGLNNIDLLTQDNVDKLLKNHELNLEVLPGLIQEEEKSKRLTQEKFDLAINLKKLLTRENMDKIEKADFDTKVLADVIDLLDKANILTQDNVDQVIDLHKVDFEKIVSVLKKMAETQILTQDNFYNFLSTFFNTSIHDAQWDQLDAAALDEPSTTIPLTDRLCSTLINLLSRVQQFFQEFFDDILEYFNKEAKVDEALDSSKRGKVQCRTENHNAFFVSASGHAEQFTDNHALSVVNASNTHRSVK